MSERAIEQEIQEKGLTAPRITPSDIDNAISITIFFTAADGDAGANHGIRSAQQTPLDLLTFCVITLNNGFTVTGESACASPENFNAEIGRKIAFENARSKIWPLEGYVLRNKLAGI
jgi:hypothetical protein